MPTFTYSCLLHDEELTVRLDSPTRPDGNVPCPECGNPMQRILSNTNIVLKGATAANGYYVPETNAAMGLGSALDMEKEAVKRPEEFLSEEDRELKRDYDKEKKAAADKLNERIKKIENKYPGYMEKYNKVLKAKSKQKKEQRKYRG